MSVSQTADIDLDARRRRAQFRAWHRGMREMDLIMGRFADAQMSSLTEAEIAAFEALLEAQDQDVFSWLTGEVIVPAEYDTDLFRKMLAFHSHVARIEF